MEWDKESVQPFVRRRPVAMMYRKLVWFVLLSAAVGSVPARAFADAKGDVMLVAEKGQLAYTVNHSVVNTGTRTVAVTVKTTWAENLKANERVYQVELKAGEKKFLATERPPQVSFKAVIT